MLTIIVYVLSRSSSIVSTKRLSDDKLNNSYFIVVEAAIFEITFGLVFYVYVLLCLCCVLLYSDIFFVVVLISEVTVVDCEF